MIYILRNPFDVFRKHVDYKKYKDLINKRLEDLILFFKNTDLKKNFENIKKLFKDLLEGNVEYNSQDVLHKIAYLASRFLKYDILLSEGKITKEFKAIHDKWFSYIFGRIMKYKQNFSKAVLEDFHSDFPVGDFEIYKTIAERAIFNYGRADLANILADPNLHPLIKLLEFENFYKFDYANFFVRCEHFGKEISKFEGKQYGKDLKIIFQIGNNNERTPPKIIEKEFIRLIATRNAISHPETAGIRLINNNKVRIMNYSPKEKKYTFNQEVDLIELWNIYYILTILDRGFVSAALAADIIQDLNIN